MHFDVGQDSKKIYFIILSFINLKKNEFTIALITLMILSINFGATLYYEIVYFIREALKGMSKNT